ncbi:MAG: LCP family protein [Eubacterium sp.]
MEKESYSIDSILSEVKKRREENELKLKGEDTSPKPEKEEAAFVLDGETDEEPALEDIEFSDNSLIENDLEEARSEAEQEEKENEPVQLDEVQEQENEPDEQEALEEEAKEEAVVSDNQQTEPPKEAEQHDGMVDLLSLAEADEDEAVSVQENEEKVKFFKTKKGKIIKTVIIILASLIVIAVVFAVLYANNLLDKITSNNDAQPYEAVTYYDGMDFLQENFPTIDEVPAYQVSSYREYLKQWYTNGDPVSSTHILNVLLIGEDTRNEKISDASRADSAIIASINVDTGEIHLTSILRDLFVYYEVDGVGQYGKINESASNGGMETYIKTLERYYKIVIDNYAVVNFASFPKIIDSLDGVTINITSAEINEVNSHPKRYGGVTITQSFEGTEGKMLLDGKQALAYCRIRKIDSDGARANRQKTVLNALFKKMKSAGTVDAVKVVNDLVSYVYTGYSKKELIEIGNTALKDGWLDYEVKTANVPSTENCKGGQKFSAAPGSWIWLADIPKDAYELQMRIYGKSNISLNENRADYISIGR